jgi:hypothetical protein
MALVIFHLFVIRSAIPNFDYVVIAYLLGSFLVMIFTLASKQRAFREAWHKAQGSA